MIYYIREMIVSSYETGYYIEDISPVFQGTDITKKSKSKDLLFSCERTAKKIYSAFLRMNSNSYGF